MTVGPAGSHTGVDGRSLRSERTRGALARAYLDLVTEGDLRPTAERIAERAGCSARSVFKHFPDREALLATASDIQEGRIRDLVEPIDPATPLPERLEAFAAQRARTLEFISPVRRAALLVEPFSEVVAGRLGLARGLAAAQVEHVFGPELGRLPDGERAALLAGLVATSSWPIWNSLRAHQGLDPGAAGAVVRGMLSALLKDS
ncbi:MAG: hypothetical protein QOJ07_2798 [Thermoleophilaceae bacterium]|nr:hypothetical protein [Thermoleophilaceae bacterium]